MRAGISEILFIAVPVVLVVAGAIAYVIVRSMKNEGYFMGR